MISTQPLPAYELTGSDLTELDRSLAELDGPGLDPGGSEFYEQDGIDAGRLPAGLRGFLRRFRTHEPAAACLIRGLPVAADRIGPTPASWRTAAVDRTRREQVYLALVASALGDVFSWSTLQDGRLIAHVVPIQGEDTQQSGHGQVLLEWHTEDGFHPYRCDYLLLFGMRNEDRTPTTVASVRDVTLTTEQRRVLAGERFHILPDDEHLRQLAAVRPEHPALAQMRRMRTDPEPVAVLFGDETAPYLRIDPFFMRPVDGDTAAAAALDAIVAELARVQQDVVVDAGTLLVVDNYLAVHGRRAFTARFDGTDRWLMKAIVTRDLRKSRSARSSAASRLLHDHSRSGLARTGAPA